MAISFGAPSWVRAAPWAVSNGERRPTATISTQRSLITSMFHIYTLVNGQSISWGSWSAIDVATGRIVWQTADPTPGALAMGAVSVATGVVYAGSMSGHMYGMDSNTGQVLS